MAKVSPFKFFQEVRSETQKVTWPTRREVMITTIMVFVMVILAGIFFSVSDQIIRFVVTLVHEPSKAVLQRFTLRQVLHPRLLVRCHRNRMPGPRS